MTAPDNAAYLAATIARTGFAALERPLHPVEERTAGDIPWLHWSGRGRRGAEFSDEFFALDMDPAVVLATIAAARPGPDHLIAEITTAGEPNEAAYIAGGYEFGSREPLMLASPIPVDPPEIPVDRVTSPEQVDVILAAHEAIGYPKRLFTAELLADPNLSIRAIWSEGEFVALGKAALLPEGAYITDIMTMPAHRRRGYGTALMRALHQDALAAGCPVSVLTSTAMAKSLYQSLGYREVGTLTLYVSPEHS